MMRAPLFVARCAGSIERDVLRSMCVGYRMMVNVLRAVRSACCALRVVREASGG